MKKNYIALSLLSFISLISYSSEKTTFQLNPEAKPYCPPSKRDYYTANYVLKTMHQGKVKAETSVTTSRDFFITPEDQPEFGNYDKNDTNSPFASLNSKKKKPQAKSS